MIRCPITSLGESPARPTDSGFGLLRRPPQISLVTPTSKHPKSFPVTAW
jgi:hypothetical protein